MSASAFTIECDATVDRAIWLEARRSGIGSSDIAGVTGLSPWSSPLKVWKSKVVGTGGIPAASGLSLGVEPIGEWDEEETDEIDEEAGEPAEWGSEIEPIVLRRYGEKTGRHVQLAQLLLRSTEDRHLLATLDGEQIDRADGEYRELGKGNVEVKCTALVRRWVDGPPPFVVAQVQQQLYVTARDWSTVAVLFRGNRGAEFTLRRDESLIDKLREAGRLFWQLVESRIPPSADPEKDLPTLKSLYPDAVRGAVLDLVDGFVPLAERRRELLEQRRELEAELRAIEIRVREAMGAFEVGRLSNGREFTLRKIEVDEHPVSASSYRRFGYRNTREGMA